MTNDCQSTLTISSQFITQTVPFTHKAFAAREAFPQASSVATQARTKMRVHPHWVKDNITFNLYGVILFATSSL